MRDLLVLDAVISFGVSFKTDLLGSKFLVW